MHIFFFPRGVQQFVEVYLAHLQSQYWIWERTNLKTGKKEKTLVQGALRPSYLGAYEYVFPEEALAEVVAVLNIQQDKSFRMKVLRKMFGLEPIPDEVYKQAKEVKVDIYVEGTNRGLTGIRVPGTGACVIGIKRDRRGDMYGYNQEAL